MVMFFAPHTLVKKSAPEIEVDEYGRYSASEDNFPTEEAVCRCRCDDNSTREFHDGTGQTYRPSYHIVGSDAMDLKEGDDIVVYDSDGNIRGQGRIYNIKRTNVLGYWELWV